MDQREIYIHVIILFNTFYSHISNITQAPNLITWDLYIGLWTKIHTCISSFIWHLLCTRTL